MKKLTAIVGLALLLMSVCPALAADDIGQLLEQSRQALQAGRKDEAVLKMEQALEVVWQQADLWVAKAVLVSRRPTGYGVYQPRPNNVYLRNEPVLLYVEPMGYRHRKRPDGQYEFGLVADFLVKRPNGEILGGQTNFQRLTMTSHHPNREFFLNLTYTFQGLPVGKYIIETVLHDLVSQAKTTVSTEFEIGK